MNQQAGLLFLFAAFAAAPDAPPPLQPREPLRGHSAPVTCIVFSPDGKTLVSCSAGDKSKPGQSMPDIRVWDIVKGKESAALTDHKAQVFGAAFSADGKTLATGADDGTMILWDMTTNAARTTLTAPRRYFSARSVALSPDAKKLVVAADKEVWAWNAEGGKEISSFKRPVTCYYPAAFSPDLTLLASGHYQDVDLWDTAKGKEKKVLPDHHGSVGTMAFTADGKTLAVVVSHDENGKYASEFVLWDVEKGEQRKTLRGRADLIGRFALSPDGKWIAFANGLVGSLDGWELRLLDVAADRVVATVPLRWQKEFVQCLAFSPDNKILAAGYSDGTVRLWDIVAPKEK
jgi:WD40 repeat protein